MTTAPDAPRHLTSRNLPSRRTLRTSPRTNRGSHRTVTGRGSAGAKTRTENMVMTDQAFPPQQQDPPGLTDEMQPGPDHGEDSYEGTGRLEGRKALITGVTPASAALSRSRMPAREPTSRSPTWPRRRSTLTRHRHCSSRPGVCTSRSRPTCVTARPVTGSCRSRSSSAASTSWSTTPASRWLARRASRRSRRAHGPGVHERTSTRCSG